MFTIDSAFNTTFSEICRRYMIPNEKVTYNLLSRICTAMFDLCKDDISKEKYFCLLLKDGDEQLMQIRAQLAQVNSKESQEADSVKEEEFEAQINEYLRCYRHYVPGLMDAVCTLNLEEDVFYHTLWEQLISFPWHNDQDISFACAQLWMDNRIPYYNLGGKCQIEESEIKRAVANKSIRHAQQKARFILNYDYSSRLDEAYQLVGLLNKRKTNPQKVALMAYILAQISSRDRE